MEKISSKLLDHTIACHAQSVPRSLVGQAPTRPPSVARFERQRAARMMDEQREFVAVEEP